MKDEVLNVLKRELTEEEKPKVISALENTEKDLNEKIESIIKNLNEKLVNLNYDYHLEIGDSYYRDKIIKKSIESLVKSL